jgi:hypothetical protein
VTFLRYFQFFVVIFLSGCGIDPNDVELPKPQENAPAPIGQSFDPSRTGTITGQVTWSDRLPAVAPIEYKLPKPDGLGFETHLTANPNRPKTNASTRAIGDAVVFLKCIDVAASRGWDLPAVSVAIGDGQIEVLQGNYRGRSGFVRRGDSIEMKSIEMTFHIIRGRGDDFFSLTFPTPNDPVKRTLNQEGRIELSSGTGLSFMRADLFVSDHPYYTRTELNGFFRFDLVPPGKCELVVWLPNWQAGKPIYEPESAIIARHTYAPPYERVSPIMVESGQTSSVSVSLP